MLPGRKIRSPRRLMRPPSDVMRTEELEQKCSIILTTIKHIIRGESFDTGFETIYRSAYTIVLAKRSAELYARIIALFEKEIPGGLEDVIDIDLKITGSSLLDTVEQNAQLEMLKLIFTPLEDRWRQHVRNLSLISDVVVYLDRAYTVDAHVPRVSQKGTAIFMDTVESDMSIAKHGGRSMLDSFTSIFISHYDLDRKGEIVDRNCLSHLASFLRTISQREHESLLRPRSLWDQFLVAFLESSRSYYRQESAVWLRYSTAGAYVRMANCRIQDEEQRCREILGDDVAKRMLAVMAEELITHPAAPLAKPHSDADIKLLETLKGRFSPIAEADALVTNMSSMNLSPQASVSINDWRPEDGLIDLIE